MQKFFIKTNQINNNEIIITDQDVKHISNVLRMKVLDKIQVCNEETGENYIVEIQKINNEEIFTNILEKLQEANESKVKIDLYQGLPKSDKMEYIIQKTTEIGVNKIIPVDMIRCVTKLEEKEVKKKLDRWQKIAEAAAKQSKRDKIPKIENKIKLNQLLGKISEYDVFLVAYEEEKENTLKQELKKLANKEEYKIGVMIGPEGGIDKKEIELLKETKVVTLGNRILRCETAPVVVIANIIYELED